MTACMGGFRCPRRAACAHYLTAANEDPIERLCEPGQLDAFESVTARGNRIRAEAAAIVAAGAADPMTLEWARQMVKQNPRPIPAPLEADELEWSDL